MSGNNNTIIRCDDMSFYYAENKPLILNSNFTLRRGAKITLMGQNGAGKSTLFKLLTGELQPQEGRIIAEHKLSVALSRQVVPRDQYDWTVREFFQNVFDETIYDIDRRIDEVLPIVGFHWNNYDAQMRDFSGGQHARLLLASALIQEPDLLLLDEPTNNLDQEGIEHLTDFLKHYSKTVMVISHDADFLNSFTEGVLYLDVYSKNIEQYVGNYYNVLEQVEARIAKEKSQNARLEKNIQAKKDKANFFANKGGRLRAVAKRMREVAAEAEENKVDLRQDDKTIRSFTIPVGGTLMGKVVTIESFTRMVNGTEQSRKVDITLRKGQRLLIKGPNGIGKSTLLEKLARNDSPGAQIARGVTIGYYRQDFSTLNFDHTVYESLAEVMDRVDEQVLRSTAAGFLITGEIIHNKIGTLSEGQKGLVSFARLVLQKPGLLILDEPTNHINFRHIPIIAEALDAYEGAMILISHVPEFVESIRIDETFDLAKKK